MLRWIDGFDGYPDATLISARYTFADFGVKLDLGRNGYGQCLNFYYQYADTEIIVPSFVDHDTWVVGFAFNQTVVSTSITVLDVVDTLTVQVRLDFDGTNHVFSLVRGDGVTLAVGTKVINPGIWYFVELKVVIGAGGSYTLRVNEAVDFAGSANTKNSVNDSANSFRFKKSKVDLTPDVRYSIDDLYILDDTGTMNNDFLGDVTVEALTTDGAGFVSDWVAVGAFQNYLAVQDYDLTKYVKSVTSGAMDSYGFSDLTAISGSTGGVSVCVYGRNNDVGVVHSLSATTRSGGVDSITSAQVVDDVTIQINSYIFEQDPNTSAAWTADAINAAEFGIKLIT